MSPNSTLDLSTYEGRRALWAAEMLSGKFVPYLGGGLRGPNLTGDYRPQCCCLGVACEVILTVNPRLLSRGPRESYVSNWNPSDASHGYLSYVAARWYGLVDATDEPQVAPAAKIDATFIEQFKTENDARASADRQQMVLHTVNGSAGSWYLPVDFTVGDQIGLATMNDAGVPWEIIAGLITRECLHGAQTGPVEE